MSRPKGKKKQLKIKKNQSRSQHLIIVIVLITLAIILFLGLLDSAGLAGNFLAQGFLILLGWVSWVVPLFFLILFYLFLNYFKIQKKQRKFNVRVFSLFLLVLISAGIAHLGFVSDSTALNAHKGGGYLGYAISYFLVNTFGNLATILILVCIFLVTLIIIFDDLIKIKFFKSPLSLRNQEEAELEDDEDGHEEIIEVEKKSKKIIHKKAFSPLKRISEEIAAADSTLSTKSYPIEKENLKITVPLSKGFPKVDLPLNLLESDSSKAHGGDTKANVFIIKKTLENFSIPVEMKEINVGPTVTQYTLKPSEGVKLSRITSLSNDLALALAAHPIRIEAPIPGKSLVGIEVPNQKVAIIRLREILGSSVFRQRKNNLTLGLGRNVAGDICLADLSRMPHLLVAGATGSGKTIFLNTIILSLLYQNSIDDLKFIFIDPKRVELTLYNGLPHLLTPVITDVTKTVNALKWAVSEMERRFDVIAEAKKRDISSYNSINPNNKLPYIVIVIDELADLMAVAAQDIEACIIRLAQMARAIGIHLVMATQRPSVDVITGLIKANITARVAFSVVSNSDSRTILDFSGAEKLLGRGDMLFTNAELSKPKRIQGAYVSDEEIKGVVDYLKNIAEPHYEDNIIESRSSLAKNGRFRDLQEDELLPQARETIIRAGKASASFLQRRLRVGYARAARLLDLLEEEGTIGPADGAKPREVYKKSYEEDGEPEERTYDNDL